MLVVLARRGHRGPDREVLDDVRAPAVVALGQRDADDPLGLERLGLGLHALHRQLAGVVERLREVRHLGVAADPPHPAAEALVGDVVDARPHHEPERPVAGRDQRVEVLAGEVARERAAVRRAVELALGVAHGGADGDELGEVVAPLAAADVEPHGDDPVRAELVGLLLHARHRELAGVVHRLRQDVHLLVLAPRPDLEADVVDRRPDDEPERLEARRLDEQELVDREVAREEAAVAHAREALDAVLGDARRRGGVVLLGLLAHVVSLGSLSCRSRYVSGGGSSCSTSTTAVPRTCISITRSV